MSELKLRPPKKRRGCRSRLRCLWQTGPDRPRRRNRREIPACGRLRFARHRGRAQDDNATDAERRGRVLDRVSGRLLLSLPDYGSMCKERFLPAAGRVRFARRGQQASGRNGPAERLFSIDARRRVRFVRRAGFATDSGLRMTTATWGRESARCGKQATRK